MQFRKTQTKYEYISYPFRISILVVKNYNNKDPEKKFWLYKRKVFGMQNKR